MNLPPPPPPKRLKRGFEWPGGLQTNASNATLWTFFSHSFDSIAFTTILYLSISNILIKEFNLTQTIWGISIWDFVIKMLMFFGPDHMESQNMIKSMLVLLTRQRSMAVLWETLEGGLEVCALYSIHCRPATKLTHTLEPLKEEGSFLTGEIKAILVLHSSVTHLI